jgi:2-iminoacetate synthase
MGLLYHSRELENRFGIGPHTLSFPRITPAKNAPAATRGEHTVSDEQLRRIITVLRLSVPHAGMILTARENPRMRRDLIPLGITQTDASSRIGLGAYARSEDTQEAQRQQFILNDTRSLDSVIRELAGMGYITSFCTAGYRCGRTGSKIMDLLRDGTEGQFCKVNAVLTFREWLDDFASEETKAIGEQVIRKEIEELRTKISGSFFSQFLESYNRTAEGSRDLYF